MTTVEDRPQTVTEMANETSKGQLLVEVTDHIGVITLNRPDRMNAISGPMLSTLSRTLIEFQRDPDVRVVVLTGAGRGFCAGLDLQDQGQRIASDDEMQVTPPAQLFDLRDAPPIVLHRMDKPVICALNGAAAGYGMDLALLCDIRLAGEHGKLAGVATKRNLLPESGGGWLLPRLVGWSTAADILFRGRIVDAEECRELGLVAKVVPDDELVDEAMSWAADIAANAPLAVQATKRLMRLGVDETFEATVDHTLLELRVLMGMDDFKEGVSAVLDRRDPEFTGR
jgi:enoyl-CoA hydratase/carnithine racemase